MARNKKTTPDKIQIYENEMNQNTARNPPYLRKKASRLSIPTPRVIDNVLFLYSEII